MNPVKPQQRVADHSVGGAPTETEALFGRVAAILDQARSNVVRAVNTQMVWAYWMIGREMVEALQGGQDRAAYGKGIVDDLSRRLTQRYGKGYSSTNLKYFRSFYQAFPDRLPIRHPVGDELTSPGVDPMRQGFSPQLPWSHYRALMQVTDLAARDFYEQEAMAGGWDKRTLERQIHTLYYERTLKSPQPARMLAEGRKLTAPTVAAVDALKNPYVLEFLGLPNMESLRESSLERAVITHLQRFLLELGSGFAFVARQKHIRIEEQDRFIDLVFYHCRLKFYLLIDLKVGKLTHGDVGQMDGYVRMYDGLFTAPDDNPTIGLILCTEKSETVARYSVLNDRKQIFASKYMLSLPTEEQLRLEIERERRLIESAREDSADE